MTESTTKATGILWMVLGWIGVWLSYTASDPLNGKLLALISVVMFTASSILFAISDHEVVIHTEGDSDD